MVFLLGEAKETNLYFNNCPMQEEKNIRKVDQAKSRSRGFNKIINKKRKIVQTLIIILIKVLRLLKTNTNNNRRKIKPRL